MRSAGVGFPNGPADDAFYLAAPGPLLMLDSEGRWHIDRYRAAGRPVVWRSMATPPARLGWSPSRYVDAVLRHVGEQQTSLVGGLIWANEWNLAPERGDDANDWEDVERRYTFLNAQIIATADALRRQVRCDLWYPAWSPHQFWRENVDRWAASVDACDVLAFHEYETLERIRDTYQWLRSRWPDKPLALTEWNARQGGTAEIRRILAWLSEVERDDPNFIGAYYFIGKWFPPADSWTSDMDLEGHQDRLALFTNPPTARQEPTPMNDIESFIREATAARGIDPGIAIRVAESEGSITEYARRGTFDTGSSWWPFQLHYGGAGYEYLGTVAGMGNGFTKLTGWQPGDVAAWRDSVRYALNRAKANGWGAWYGAAHVGISQWQGIDRAHSWDAAAERWDYETGGAPVATPVTYNRDHPAVAQRFDWDCQAAATRWALRALGRYPSAEWTEQQMVADGVVSHADGLLDASGAGLAQWITDQYGEFGFYANSEPFVTFDGAALEGDHAYPLLLGGRSFGAAGHWVGCRGYDAARGVLLLANPSDGYTGIRQEMTREQFDARGPWSMVRVLHPDLLAAPAPIEPPAPAPSRAAVLVGEIRARLDELETLVA